MSLGMLIFSSGVSQGSKMWFLRITQSIKTVEMINLTLLLSLVIAF